MAFGRTCTRARAAFGRTCTRARTTRRLLVEAAIRRASVNRTVLYTTHRVKAAADADEIVVMAHGRIVEQGTHAQLLAADGAYAQLLRVGDAVSEEEAGAVVDLSLSGATCELEPARPAAV